MPKPPPLTFEAYLEQVLQQIKVDAERRAKIADGLRARFETQQRQLIANGCPAEDAQAILMERWGDPRDLSDKPDWTWRVFLFLQLIALCLVLRFWCPWGFDDWFWLLICIGFPLSRMHLTIEDGLLVQGCLPFGTKYRWDELISIERAEQRKPFRGPLLVETSKGRKKIRALNYRGRVLALQMVEAAQPGCLGERLRAELDEHCTRYTIWSPPRRLLFHGLWLLVFAGCGLWTGPMLAREYWSAGFFLCALGMLVLIALQWRLANDLWGKRILANLALLIPSFCLCAGLTFICIRPPWTTLWIMLLMGCGLAAWGMLWARRTRQRLGLLATLLLASVGFSALWANPRQPPVQVIDDGSPWRLMPERSIAELADGKLAILSKDGEGVAYIVTRNGEQQNITHLPDGWAQFIPPPAGTQAMIAMMGLGAAPGEPHFSQTLAANTQLAWAVDGQGKLEPFQPAYFDAQTKLPLGGGSPWSPDGKLVIMTQPQEMPAGTRPQTVVREVATGKEVYRGDLRFNQGLTWTGPSRVRLAATEGPIQHAILKVHELDVRTSAARTLAEIPLGVGEPYEVLPGLTHALIGNRLRNLEDGSELVLPGTTVGEVPTPHDWQPALQLLAYGSGPRPQGNDKPVTTRLTVLKAGQGEILHQDWPTPQVLTALRIAPDGKALLIIRRPQPATVLPASWARTRLEVIDVPGGSRRLIEEWPPIHWMRSPQGLSSDPHGLPQWSEDGQRVRYLRAKEAWPGPWTTEIVERKVERDEP